MAISLFTPGPTHIPDRVLRAMSLGELHHRTAEFRKIFADVTSGLQELFQADSPPILLTCSGTGGMEAVIANSVGEEDVLGYLDAGKFGARWGAIAKAKQRTALPLPLEWGESPSISCVRTFFQDNPSITHFALQYCETSTTILHDIPSITKMIRDEFPHIYILIDAISAATTVEIPLNSLHWDAVVLASQKAFMLPPGLSMVFLSARYWEKREGVSPTTLYFDLKKERNTQAKNNAAWTPAISLIAGMKEALVILAEEGWQNVYARHTACRARALEWFPKLGIEPVTTTHPAPGVTGGFLHERSDVEVIRSRLFCEKGISIAGGQDAWKGRALRFGHMGMVAPEDLDRCFRALEEVLSTS